MTFPYAPRVVREYLRTVLDSDVRVAFKVPAERPDKLVTIKTVPTNPGDNDALSWRRMIVHCWSPDEITAGELSETVFAELRKARYVKGNGIRDVKVVGSPARLDFPDDPTPRFQMTVDVLLRALP